MKPAMDHHLMAIAGTLATRIIPALPEDHYAAGDARMTALLSVMMAQEADRAADILIRENRAMRALFARAAGFAVGPLAAHLADAAAGDETSFRISALEAANAALKTLLINLHSDIEGHEPELDREIWTLLHQGATDRLLVIPAA